MLRGFREGYETTREDLEKLPPVEQLNCHDGVSDLLALHTFDNLYIRWFGVARDGSVTCRGGRIGLQLADVQAYHIDDVWSLVSVQGPGGVRDLLVGQR
jgi:hypothetical protein